MNTRLAIPVLAATVAVAPAARAQAPLALTLDEAIARGVETSPDVAEARAREAAAEQTRLARAALKAPTVTAQSGLLRTNHVDEFAVPEPDGSLRVIFPDIPTNYRARLEAAVPLYLGGRVEALVAGAEADGRAAAADRRAAEADVRLQVAEAYWQFVTAREAVAVLERSLARTEAWAADVQARVDVGLLPPHEVRSADAERARRQVQLIEGRNAVALATVTLARLIGADPDVDIVPESPVDVPTPGAAALARRPADELVAAARDDRAERTGLEARQASLRATGASAMADTRPQLAAVVAVEPARPNPRFVPRTDRWDTAWDLGVQLTWSFWDGGRARATRAAAEAQADAVAARVRGFDDGLAVEVRARLLDLASGRSALDASAEAVAAATEVRRVIEERFEAGVATSTEVLDAEVVLREAELERTRIQAQLRVSEARLLRAVGR